MRPKSDRAVGGAGSSGGEGADAVGSVIEVESAPCDVLVWEIACWTTAVAAAGLLPSPCYPQTAKQTSKRKRCRRLEKGLRGRDGDR